jgi:c-di-GMP-binding flagellar brake protein YcgR
MGKVEKRKHRRYLLKQNSKVETSIHCGTQTLECQLDDISVSGIGALANGVPGGLVNNSLVRIIFKTPANQFKLTARVVYYYKTTDDAVHRYGLEFVLDDTMDICNIYGLIQDDPYMKYK